MKGVYIEFIGGRMFVNGKKVPGLLLTMARGAVGKCFVVKHYKGGKRVLTKYPDMSGIVASKQQRVCRDLFREAVVYAKWIVSDEERKKAFRKTLPRRKQKHMYQAAIRLYMSMQGDAKWLRKQLAVKAMMRVSREDVVVNGNCAVWREGVEVQGIVVQGDFVEQGLGMRVLERLDLEKQVCFFE